MRPWIVHRFYVSAELCSIKVKVGFERKSALFGFRPVLQLRQNWDQLDPGLGGPSVPLLQPTCLRGWSLLPGLGSCLRSAVPTFSHLPCVLTSFTAFPTHTIVTAPPVPTLPGLKRFWLVPPAPQR